MVRLKSFGRKPARSVARKAMAMLVTLVLALGMVPAAAFAAPGMQAGSIDETATDQSKGGGSVSVQGLGVQEVTALAGSGTEADPYTIGTAEELAFFRDQVNAGTNYSGQYVKLTADIDLSGYDNWEPIGNGTYSSYLNGNSFKGVFDGDGHEVSNLTITSVAKGYAGLFGLIYSSTIKDLVLASGNVSASASFVGGVAGMAAYESQFIRVGNGATVKNSGTGTSSAYYTAGGICGGCSTTKYATFTECFNKGSVEAYSYVGGICGYYAGVVTSCYNTGAIYARISSGQPYVAGLVANGQSYVYNSYNDSAVTYGSSGYTYWGAINSSSSSNYSTEKPNYYNDAKASQANGGNTQRPGNTALSAISGTLLENLTAVSDYADVWKDGSGINKETGSPALAWEKETAGTPSFTVDPADARVVQGQGIELSATAVTPEKDIEGYDGTLSIKWYSNTTGKADPATDTELSGATDTPTAGETQNTLASKITVTPAGEPGDKVYYYAVVTNSYTGSEGAQVKAATSKLATVTVTSSKQAETPTVSLADESKSISVNEGASVTLEVAASLAGATDKQQGTLTYQWYRNSANSNEGGDAVDGASGSVEDGKATYTFTALGDTNYYYCVVTNTAPDGQAATATSDVASVTGKQTEISTAQELYEFMQAVNSGTTYEGKTVKLVADIDLQDYDAAKTWTPIGKSSSAPFKGTFDGGKHTISGLSINSTSTYQALFGYISYATIKDLVVEGSVTAGGYSAGIVANVSYSALSNLGNKVTVVGSGSNVGGVAAYLTGNTSIITASYNKASVTGAGSADEVGGVVGCMNSGTKMISCYNLGAVETKASGKDTGGLTGRVSSGTIDNSYNYGTVTIAGGSYGGADSGYGTPTSTSANYYLDTSYSSAKKATSKTADEMAADAFVTLLNDGDYTGTWLSGAAIGQASPMLSWEYVAGTPNITTQPEGAEYEYGATIAALTIAAELPTEAAESGELHYQWYEAAGASAKPATDTAVGADAASYTPNVDAGQAKYYYCVVTDKFGGEDIAVTSKVVKVQVYSNIQPATPVFSKNLENATVKQMGALELSVETNFGTATEGFDSPAVLEYQWYKLASADAELSDEAAISGATEATYAVPASETGTVGAKLYYACKVTNVFEGVRKASATSAVAEIEVVPVTVSTPADLKEIADNVNNGVTDYDGVEVKLLNDIDLSTDDATKTWMPIGNYASYSSNHSFKGTFDGGKHTISGLNVQGTSGYQGLFGYIQPGTSTTGGIRDLVVKGSVVGNGSNVGGVVGYAPGVTARHMVFTNIGSEVDVTNTATSSGSTGGVVGTSAYAEYSGCYSKGGVEKQIKTGGTNIGGIVGTAGASTTIVSCYNTAAITSTYTSTSSYSYAYVGGITGSAASLKIVNCINVGSVTSNVTASAYDGSISGTAMGTIPATDADANYWLEGSSNHDRANGTTTQNARNIKVTADQLKLEADYNDASLLTALNNGSYAGTWKDGAMEGQDSPILAWESDKLTVTFDPKLASSSKVKPAYTEAGGKVSAPDAPTAIDCNTFVAWYADEELTQVFDFANTAIDEDITLYGKWDAHHTLTKHEAVAAETCNDEGSDEYWSCSVCGKFFSDEAGTQEIAENSWKHYGPHNWGQPTWTWSEVAARAAGYELVDEFEEGGKYLIVAENGSYTYAVSSSNHSTSYYADSYRATASVTVADGFVTDAPANAVWTYQGGKLVSSDGKYLTKGAYDSYLAVADSTTDTWAYTDGQVKTSANGNSIRFSTSTPVGFNLGTTGTIAMKLYKYGDATEDGWAAKADFTCQTNDEHKESRDAEVTKSVEGNTTTFTATAELDGTTYTDTKEIVDIKAPVKVTSVNSTDEAPIVLAPKSVTVQTTADEPATVEPNEDGAYQLENGVEYKATIEAPEGYEADAEAGQSLEKTFTATADTYSIDFALSPIAYAITYDLDGGALAEGAGNPESYTIESDAITLANPTKAGYSFAGWTGTDIEEATDAVTIAAGSTGERTYTATWTEFAKVDVPTAVADLVYTGEEQAGVKAGEGYALSPAQGAEGVTPGLVKALVNAVEQGDAYATDAGAYTVTATLADGYKWADGSLDAQTITFTIAPATLTATASGGEVGYYEYDGFTPSVEVTGFVNDETAETAAGYTAPTASKPETAPEAGGDVTITAAGGAAKNYAFTFVDGTLKVGSKADADAAAKAEADAKAAKEVEDKLNALPTAADVKVSDEDAIAAAESVLATLTESNPDAAALVSADAKQKLADAKDALDAAKKAAQEEAANAPIGGVAAGQVETAGTGATAAAYEVLKPATAAAPGEVYYKTAKASKKAKTATVPATVTIKGGTYKVVGVKANAFKGYKKLKKVSLGSNVADIQAKAFYGLKALTKVTGGANVTTIGKQAFAKCKKLKSFTIGAKVTSAGAKAFSGCSKLKKVTVKSKNLTTKASVKNCLKGSKVTTVKLKGLGSAKKAVKTAFAKGAGKKTAKVK